MNLRRHCHIALVLIAVLAVVVVAEDQSADDASAEPSSQAEPTSLTYYVSPSGSDDNDGKTLQTPFKTIQRAADVMNPGDTCCIRQGVYRETIRPAKSGQQGAPITFQPYQNENVTISGTEPITGWQKDEGKIYKAPCRATFSNPGRISPTRFSSTAE
jgi:hypothetical protein